MGLLDFLNKLPTMNEVVGSMGEQLAKMYSKTLPGALVLHDVLIDGAEGNTSQLDLVMVGNKGVYVVEVKMYTDAKIYGDTQKSKWHYYLHGKKYEIYSPVKQNQNHVKYLKTFLKDFGDVPYFSIITMICEDFKISGDFDNKTVLCNSIPAMDRALQKLAEKAPVVLDDAKKQAIFEHIKNNQYVGKAARIEHKERVAAYKAELEKTEQQKMCPYCKTELVLRTGKNGAFYGCKNFPRCRYTCSK